MKHQKQLGFTLIELIIVIVILGILSATAAPKFIDIQSDALESTIKGLSGAISSGAQLVYAKSAISGEQNNATATSTSDAQVTISGVNVDTAYGYPKADIMSLDMLQGWLNINDTDWTFVAAASSGSGTFGILPEGQPVPSVANWGNSAIGCNVLYTSATSVAIATVSTRTKDC